MIQKFLDFTCALCFAVLVGVAVDFEHYGLASGAFCFIVLVFISGPADIEKVKK